MIFEVPVEHFSNCYAVKLDQPLSSTSTSSGHSRHTVASMAPLAVQSLRADRPFRRYFSSPQLVVPSFASPTPPSTSSTPTQSSPVINKITRSEAVAPRRSVPVMVSNRVRMLQATVSSLSLHGLASG